MIQQKIYIVLVTGANDADPIADIFYHHEDAVMCAAGLNKTYQIIEKNLPLHQLFQPLFTFF
ncbi:hypothetical protein CPT03_16500 [Pedobacter ginsengisoli]|uniref:Uncharacterized protein n=1 Tax=Pedobacter ginsengisoli TaxID=363852 RepID=A0A2D1U8P4_9SPHI|nr:hypothetical protein [Pedobacter ginsengisoli]ATP57946.1 hypothetical protein CPT03_16500 [Pedobacter ginsengisoli]